MEEKKRFRSWLAAMLLFSLLSAAAVFFFPAYRPSGVYEAISSGAYLSGSTWRREKAGGSGCRFMKMGAL